MASRGRTPSKKRTAKKASRSKKAARVGKAAAKAPARQTPVEVSGSSRARAKGAVRVRDATATSLVEITITLRGPKLPDINALGTVSRNFIRTFRASRSDADKVSRVLRAFGLNIDKVSLDTRSMQVSGTVAQMEAAFHPNLGVYKKAGHAEFRDREGEYAVPSSLKNIVTSVLGFGERQVAQRRPARARARKSRRLHAFGPTDIEGHYRFPPGTGAGEKIAIAEFGGGYFAEDLAKYCRKFGRAVPKVTTIAVGTPVRNLAQIKRLKKAKARDEIDYTGEVMMDVQVVAGLCPDAEISVYFARDTQKGWVDLLQHVIDERPVALSISWGAAEDGGQWAAAARTAFNERLQMAALLGITVCCASGDDGSGDMLSDRHAHVDFPSSSPYALAVGGTMITHKAGKTLEQVWRVGTGKRIDDFGGSTGGGVSTIFPRPKWQNVSIKSVNKNSIDGRVVPDLTALAGPPMYDLIFLAKRDISGGTSASAPLMAALMARVNALLPPRKRQRCLTPLLYRSTSHGVPLGRLVCHDITVGNNISFPRPGIGYQATTGFDAVSGWGAPVGTSLLLALGAVG